MPAPRVFLVFYFLNYSFVCLFLAVLGLRRPMRLSLAAAPAPGASAAEPAPGCLGSVVVAPGSRAQGRGYL